MQKFRVELTRTDEFEIEIDEEIFNEKELKNWSDVFHTVDNLQEFVVYLVELMARFGLENFHEGFGKLHRVNSAGKSLDYLDEGEYIKGILVKIISEDSQCETDCTEIVEEGVDNG